MNQTDYLTKFRRAKTLETLEVMADAAERNAPGDSQLICNAFVQRENEIAAEASLDNRMTALMQAFRGQ